MTAEEIDSIRTEDEFQADEDALRAAVAKIGDTDTERLHELIILCVEERVSDALIQVIHDRTHRTVGVTTGKVQMGPWNRKHGCTFGIDPAPVKP